MSISPVLHEISSFLNIIWCSHPDSNRTISLDKYGMITRICKNNGCDKEFSVQYQSDPKRFCSKSCSARTNNRLRSPRTSESREKTSFSLRSSESRMKNQIPLSKETICNYCLKTFISTRKAGSNFSPYCSASCRNLGKKNKCRIAALKRGFGGYNSKAIEYNGIWFDSNWEIRVAKELDLNQVKWERPKKFKLSNGKSYTPDFYLPEYSIYLDPKGYVRPNRIRDTFDRISLFEKEFSTKCIIINMEKNLSWQYIKSQLVPSGRVELP